MTTGPTIQLLSRVDMVRFVPGPDHTVHRRELAILMQMLGLGVETAAELTERLAQDASCAPLAGAPAEAGALLSVLDGFCVSGRQTLIVLRADTRMSRAELADLACALDALFAMPWDLVFSGDGAQGETGQPVRAMPPDQPVPNCQIMGFSRRAAQDLAAWLRGRGEGVLLAGEHADDMPALLSQFRTAHPQLEAYLSTRPLSHRPPAGFARTARGDPKTPLMATFLALARRPRRTRT